MSSKKDRISRGLEEIGAAWCRRRDRYVDPSDPFPAQVRGERRYHIFPCASQPEVTSILRFRTLDDIQDWIDAHKRARACYDGVDMWDDAAMDSATVAAELVMGDYWASLET